MNAKYTRVRAERYTILQEQEKWKEYSKATKLEGKGTDLRLEDEQVSVEEVVRCRHQRRRETPTSTEGVSYPSPCSAC